LQTSSDGPGAFLQPPKAPFSRPLSVKAAVTFGPQIDATEAVALFFLLVSKPESALQSVEQVSLAHELIIIITNELKNYLYLRRTFLV